MDLKGRIGIIPGTASSFSEKAAGQIFRAEDSDRINKTAQPEGIFFKKPGKRMKKRSHSVNREHPEGGMSRQFSVTTAKGEKACPQKLQTPAAYATFHKIIFHKNSMTGK